MALLLLCAAILRQHDAYNEPTYEQGSSCFCAACLAPATHIGTRARLARGFCSRGGGRGQISRVRMSAWTSSSSKMTSPWSQQFAGSQPKQARSANMAARRQKFRGFLYVFTVFVYRGLGAWCNFAGPGLLLAAQTARRNDVLTSSDIRLLLRRTCIWMTASNGIDSFFLVWPLPKTAMGRYHQCVAATWVPCHIITFTTRNSNQHPRCTQKPIYNPIFASLTRS